VAGVIILYMKLIILAAGKGTRFLPITEETPKALIPILSKPLVEYKMDLFLPYVSGFIFVINDDLGFKIKEYFGNQYKNIPINYAIQGHKHPQGTFGALQCALPFIDTEEFIVCNCDDLYKKEDIENALKSKIPGIGISNGSMSWDYHGVKIENNYIKGFNRHSKSVNLVEDDYVNGFYILSREVFSFPPEFLKNGEAGLPHTLMAHLNELPLQVIPFSEWVSVEGPGDIARAEEFIKEHNLS